MPIHPFRLAALAACFVAAPASADLVAVSDAAVPVDHAVPLTPDLSAVPRATLERLAADLALENLLLTRALPPAPVDAAFPDDPEQVEAAIATLEARLLALRLHRATLSAESTAAAEASGAAAPAATGPVSPEAGADAEIHGATEGSVPYRYRYSFGLIGHSGRVRVVVRGEDGVLRTEGYNFSEFRDDAVWVKLLFRNDGDTPQRFTGAVALGQRTTALGLGRARVRELATVSLSTPVLQPGEIFEIDREVRVDHVRDVDFVEVGRVRSFPPGE